MHKFIFKYGVFFLLVVCTFNSMYSQDPTLVYIEDCYTMDSAYFEIKYEVEIIPDPSDTSSYYEDIQILQIGKNISKTFSYTNYQSDSIISKCLKQGKPYPSKSLFATTYEIYKKFNTNTIDFIDIIYDEVFLYEESILKINWQIQEDKKLILYYMCQKAIAEFRGRMYEAWFTFDIPISDGPYKFTGLPGLILEIYDTQNHYNYKCIGVKPLNPMKPITIRDWKMITNTTREKHQALYKQYYNNPFWLKIQQGMAISININGEDIDPGNFSLPYNPIELE